MKKITTKIGKQFGGYAIIKSDLAFAKYSFLRAIHYFNTSDANTTSPDLFPGHKQALDFALPLLRTGGTLMLEGPVDTSGDFDKRAYFDSGIVAYGRCFNSGLRTGLTREIFRDQLASYRDLHDWCIRVRNQHVAHSELTNERSYTGIDLVKDLNFSPRPNGVMTALCARRSAPSRDTLATLAALCDAIDTHFLTPQMSKTAAALREWALKLSQEQFDALPEYLGDPSVDEFPHDERWKSSKPNA